MRSSYNLDGEQDRLIFSNDGAGDMLTASNSEGTYSIAYNADGQATAVKGLIGLQLTMLDYAAGNRTEVMDNFGTDEEKRTQIVLKRNNNRKRAASYLAPLFFIKLLLLPSTSMHRSSKYVFRLPIAFVKICFPATLLLSACSIPESADNGTAFMLMRLGKACMFLSWDDVEELGSFEEFIKVASDKKAILAHDAFRTDGWRHEFLCMVRHNGNSLTLRILSCGPNGVFEGGRGDDLFVDVVYRKGAQWPAMKRSWESTNTSTTSKL
jgi:hypothetical protein